MPLFRKGGVDGSRIMMSHCADASPSTVMASPLCTAVTDLGRYLLR